MLNKNGIVFTKDTLTPGLKTFPAKLAAAVDLYLEGQETKVQDYARSTAPWTDRTGNARNGLFAQKQGTIASGSTEIRLYHTVPYGIWLEIRWAGQYAVIYPTVVHEGERIMAGMRRLIDKMSVAGGFL